ncbi:MAG: hemolysin family protein [Polyangiaceae bacterium]
MSAPWLLDGAASASSAFLGAVFASGVSALAFGGDVATNLLSGGRLSALAQLTDADGARFLRLQTHVQRIISRWLSLMVLGTTMTAILLHDTLAKTGLSPVACTVAALFATVVLFGALAEALGALAHKRPEAVALAALRLLRPLEWLIAPLADPLAYLGRTVSRRVKERRPQHARITETEVEFLVDASQKSGTLAPEPAEIIRNVLDFKNLTVRDVMVPRFKVSAIEIATPLAEVLALIASDGHSRYPVYRDKLDDIVGLLYVKDLFACVQSGKLDETTLSALTRKEALIAVETQSAASVLREMRQRRQHMAIVADEFGGTEGVVTLEDILEEIVGEIRDEYDTDAMLHALDGGRWLADAAIPISDLEPHLGRALPESEGAYESLGGLLVHTAGKVPDVGASIMLGGFRFVVRDADEKRVTKVEIIPTAPVRIEAPGVFKVPDETV